jgi:hypothetical protein
MNVTLHIEKSEEQTYPRLTFPVPENAERIDVFVRYPRYTAAASDGFVRAENACVVDLALEAPDGRLYGAAGSNREHVYVSPLGSSAGFTAAELPAGEWRVVAGAYRVPEGGIDVTYEIEITLKSRRLFLGDTHTHTTASDGALSMDELTGLARDAGLNYLFLTDHNNVSSPPLCEGITLLPGVEWTHYQGTRAFWAPTLRCPAATTKEAFPRRGRSSASRRRAGRWSCSTTRFVRSSPGSGGSTCRTTRWKSGTA